MTEDNLLLQWFARAEQKLRERGYAPRVREKGFVGSGIDLDSARFVGSIAHWPPDVFEFQFNSCATGEVVVLVTEKFAEEASLEAFMAKLLERVEAAEPPARQGVSFD